MTQASLAGIGASLFAAISALVPIPLAAETEYPRYEEGRVCIAQPVLGHRQVQPFMVGSLHDAIEAYEILPNDRIAADPEVAAEIDQTLHHLTEIARTLVDRAGPGTFQAILDAHGPRTNLHSMLPAGIRSFIVTYPAPPASPGYTRCTSPNIDVWRPDEMALGTIYSNSVKNQEVAAGDICADRPQLKTQAVYHDGRNDGLHILTPDPNRPDPLLAGDVLPRGALLEARWETHPLTLGTRVLNFLSVVQAICGRLPDAVDYTFEYGLDDWDIVDDPMAIHGEFRVGSEGIAFHLLDPTELDTAKAVAGGAARAEAEARAAAQRARAVPRPSPANPLAGMSQDEATRRLGMLLLLGIAYGIANSPCDDDDPDNDPSMDVCL